MSTTLTFEVPANKVAEIKALVQTYLAFNSKTTKKTKKKKLSIHDPKHPYYAKLTPEEEKGVGEALAQYERGEFTTLRTKEDIHNFVNNLMEVEYEYE
jgi:hypothetical protein